MNGRAFVDTNVFVYAFDDRDASKKAAALQLAATFPGREFVVSTQVLSEFYNAVTRRLQTPLSEPDAEAAVIALAGLEVVTVDKELVLRAIRTSRVHQLSQWDALILEAAVAAGCDELLTEDLSDGAVLRGVEIVNPFRAGP